MVECIHPAAQSGGLGVPAQGGIVHPPHHPGMRGRGGLPGAIDHPDMLDAAQLVDCPAPREGAGPRHIADAVKPWRVAW